jgi:membrane protein required for colicin V production
MLSWVDILLLAIVGLSTVVGLWRGFVVEVMSLVVWVAAFWLAFVYGDDAAGLFAAHVASPSVRMLLGYALLFLAALLAGGLATWLLGRLVRSTGLSGTDRLLGLGFGLLRGVALGCVLVLVMGFTPLPQDPWWQQSKVLPGFQRGAEWLRAWLPAAVAEHVRFDAVPLPALPIELPAAPAAANEV